jgi:hypothetical protein
MEMNYFTVVLCAALFIGVGIPAGIYLLARRGKGVAEFDVLSQVMRKSRQAWRADEDMMQELSRAVSGLKHSEATDLSGITGSPQDMEDGAPLTPDNKTRN